MKSDFMMAINQVCHERQLSVDVVIEAVETALVSAYKRNYGSNTIAARVDQNSGMVKIYVTKEVVAEVSDDKNEINLEDARKISSAVQLSDEIQIESTPEDFGRIAAQTTKQVILQRIREAERDALYRSYADREGEIVNGTVQKVETHQVILSLGKVEAILPKAEQIPTERYKEGQRLRAYVAEVSKTARGPQITVSRTHRNMLRRLLEVEVPEIYNGTVEIKAIAREAGYRSKVAVAALQEGVDPVGSCVGMRGVRIQGIVNELNGEKIDVAEWNQVTATFIANALSPAKVLNVILHDITSDKTALVVVPDKQLSLAIGKEGQNARLAAKLTGWRIDIKSAIEATRESLARASASEEIKARVSHRPEVFSIVSSILEEHQEGAELSQGELSLMSEAIELVGQAELQIAREKHETDKAAKVKASASDDIDLLAEAQAILKDIMPAEEQQEFKPEFDVEELQEDLQYFGLPIAVPSATPEPEPTPVIEAVVFKEQIPEVEPEPDPKDFIPSILESVVDIVPEPKKKEVKKQIKPIIVEQEPEIDPEVVAAAGKRKAKSKTRSANYEEDAAKAFLKRSRKRSSKDGWDDFYEE